MKTLRAWMIRLGGLFGSDRTEQEFTAEIQSHVAMHTEDGVRAGLSETEARRHALMQLGGAEQARQAYRERRTFPWIESLLRDLRDSIRTLVKHPMVTVVAVLSISLGIGANATVFSMVSRFLLRPVPVGDPDTLVALQTLHDGDACCNSFSYPLFTDVRDQAQTFSGVAGYDELVPASMGGGGDPERVWGQAATSNFFTVLEIRMRLGRGFTKGAEDAHEIVLGSGLWRRRFNSDPAIVGKSVTLSGRQFTVVGVAPVGFHGADQILNPEFWVPLGTVKELAANVIDETTRETHWVAVVARIRPGVTRTQVAAELKTLAARFAQAYPKTDKGGGFVIERAGSGALSPRNREMMLLFFGALSLVALLVLCIAGANVANLLFAQAATRQRDMALRLALGATPGRLRRRMLTESVLLGLGGGALGLVLSLWSTRSLSAIQLPAPIPLDLSISVDWRVLLYSFALSGLAGLLLGLAPAWAASRPMLSNALKGEDALARPGRRISLRNLLVVVQVAMSVVLLCLTGLFLRSLQSAAGIDIGFRAHNLLVLSVDPRLHGYTPARTADFLNRLRERAAALPGVNSAACTDYAPLSGGGRSDGIHVDGKPGSAGTDVGTDLYMATADYFNTMGIPLLAGRDFGAETANGPKTAVVNQAFAQHLAAGQNPVGAHVKDGETDYEIIGVVGNIKSRTLGEDTRPVLYRSLRQTVGPDPSFLGYTLVVHTAGSPAAVAEAIRRQVHALDRNMAIFNEETMEEHVRNAFFLPHLAASLFGVFGFIGVVLAAVGLYGVMSYAITRRTREIGIRMAMGAKPGSVERLIVRQGMVLAGIAILLGWPSAWMLSKLAASFLYGVAPHDASTFIGAPILLAAIAVIACWVPARRAASVDPMQALRAD